MMFVGFRIALKVVLRMIRAPLLVESDEANPNHCSERVYGTGSATSFPSAFYGFTVGYDRVGSCPLFWVWWY